MTLAIRSWAAKCQYPGKDMFYLGTVHLPVNAMQHEIDKALADLWASMSPHPAPPMTAVPGMVTFHPEESS